MSWVISAVSDYQPCLDLRRAVFIEEQGISEAEEWDDLDDQALHLLATIDGVPAGTVRLLTKGTTGKITRVCVAKSGRGTGLGAALIHASVDHFKGDDRVTRCELGAQEHALGFYGKLGFAPYGPTYDDAGIPHRDMELSL